jgi:methyl-accepting chemotaxis protein
MQRYTENGGKMSFDERIERLTARHEALAESVEMLRDRTAETAANLDRLAEQVARLAANTQLNFDRLTTAMLGLTEYIAGHERRITGLEGRL